MGIIKPKNIENPFTIDELKTANTLGNQAAAAAKPLTTSDVFNVKPASTTAGLMPNTASTKPYYDFFADYGQGQNLRAQDIAAMPYAEYDIWKANNPQQALKFESGEMGLYRDASDMASANITNAGLGTELGLNTETLGAASQIGQLGLGYLNYRDAHKANKAALEASKFNLAEAKKDAAATDAYRASYGLA